MSARDDRIRAVMARLEAGAALEIADVQRILGIGYGMAQDALAQARFRLADGGHAVSYATATTAYAVEADGEALERAWSYLARCRDLATRATNLARVIGGAARGPWASRHDRRIARAIRATSASAEALEANLENLSELLTAEANGSG